MLGSMRLGRPENHPSQGPALFEMTHHPAKVTAVKVGRDQEHITSELAHLTPPVRDGTLLAIHQGRFSRGTNRRADPTLYCYTTQRTGLAYSGTCCATAAEQVTRSRSSPYQPRAATGGVGPCGGSHRLARPSIILRMTGRKRSSTLAFGRAR